MVKRKRYSSVSDVLRDISPDDTFCAEFDARIAGRRVIKQLLALRAVKGLSQADIAKALGCKQSRISKLENGNDADVKFGDLRAYADAVGCDLVAHPVPRDMKPVDKVKRHAFAIKGHLDAMARLAKADDTMAEGVAAFYHECFLNLFLMLIDSARRLPLRPDESPYFRIHFDSAIDREGQDHPDCATESAVL